MVLLRKAHIYAARPWFNLACGYDSTASCNYGIGRLTSVTDTSGQTAIRYDHRGNIGNNLGQS